MDALFDAAVVADQNAKLSIFATRPAIYTPVRTAAHAPPTFTPLRGTAHGPRPPLRSCPARALLSPWPPTAQNQIFNFICELMSTAALILGALLLYQRQEMLQAPQRDLFQARGGSSGGCGCGGGRACVCVCGGGGFPLGDPSARVRSGWCWVVCGAWWREGGGGASLERQGDGRPAWVRQPSGGGADASLGAAT